MRLPLLLTISLVCLSVSGLLHAFAQGPNVAGVRSGCELADQRTISLRVENKAGASVDNLGAGDFSILEDKTSREIVKLENRTNDSLVVALLIDTSISQERSLPQTKLAAKTFVELLLRSNKDRAAVISFTGQPILEEGLTSNLADLQSAISRVKFEPPSGYVGGGTVIGSQPPISSRQQSLTGSTAIWDAIVTVTDDILKTETGSRRAMVLFTDGEDTSSRIKMADAIEYANRYDVAVFAIGIGGQEFGGPNRDALGKLTEETGGGAFFPKKAPEHSAMLRQIEQSLRSAYLLTYCASGAIQKKPFTLKIQLTNPQARESNRLSYRRYAF